MIASDLKIDSSPDGTLLLTLTGDWSWGTLPYAGGDSYQDPLRRERAADCLRERQSRRVEQRAPGVPGETFRDLSPRRHQCRESGLPAGVRKLLDLSSPEKQRSGVTHGSARQPFLARVADAALGQVKGFREVLAFIGEATLAFGRMLRGKANFRRLDLVLTIQETGAQALPIVALISFLVGMILAFIASIQLKMFGAQIYVADVVGIGIVRVMGAIMTGIIMAGRTGAAFAAQLGTMQVNEEIDALETLGLSPIEFLVLPRMLALMLMMPLLCVFSDLMGVLGGMVVGVGHARPGCQGVHHRDEAGPQPDPFFRRHVSLLRVRHHRRRIGMPARHPVRTQRHRGRLRRHLGRGHLHRLYRRGNGDHHPFLSGTGDMSVSAEEHRSRKEGRHRGGRAGDGLRQLRADAGPQLHHQPG